MNNSYTRLIDGMCATLRSEVLTRLDDEFARGQVFGVINLLNTFRVRADWSAGFLLEQIGAQHVALEGVGALMAGQAMASMPPSPQRPLPDSVPISALLALRDENNRAIAEWLAWLHDQGAGLSNDVAAQVETLLHKAMRAEVDLELKHSPRPLFAEMSSGSEA